MKKRFLTEEDRAKVRSYVTDNNAVVLFKADIRDGLEIIFTSKNHRMNKENIAEAVSEFWWYWNLTFKSKLNGFTLRFKARDFTIREDIGDWNRFTIPFDYKNDNWMMLE